MIFGGVHQQRDNPIYTRVHNGHSPPQKYLFIYLKKMTEGVLEKKISKG